METTKTETQQVTNKEVKKISTRVMVGAGMLAAVACGEYPDVRTCAAALTSVKEVTKPEPALVKAYDAKYQIWKKLYPALKGIL